MRIPHVRSRLALLVAGLACALLPTAATAAEADRSSFLLGVLPDTQFYSRYSTAGSGELFMNRYGTEPYAEQTKWLVQNKTGLKIPFVTHLGDIVDRVNQTQEWQVADEAMKTLETGGLPYSILAGNHDVTGNPASEPFKTYFPTSRAAAQSTFGGRDASGMSEWHKFTAEGRTFLVLALSWDPSDATIEWARGVLAANPTLPAIVTTHDILAIDSDAVTAVETGAGLRLWDKLIKDNDQIFLTINGHNHGSAHLRKTNTFGHSVDQIVWDYQMAYQGGNGYLGLLEFDFTNQRIQSAVVSPWIRLKPKNTIVPEYDVAVKAGPNENLTLPIDWNARFAGFQTAPAPVAPSNGSLVEAAKAKVLEGYEEPEVTLPSLPLNDTDYPEVPGTLAHWRFDASKLGPLQPNAVGAKDIAGGADMRRAPLNAPNTTGVQLEDLQISSEHHALSSDGASACFPNNNNAGRVSFMNTLADAAINADTFQNGYTIETFVKIDPSWVATNNQWMGALNREGSRREVPNMINPGYNLDEPVFTLGVSNLREIQWNAAAYFNTGWYERTNWSGEVMPSRWMHIASINDPVTKTSTLYVDGAPVLRNTINALGLNSAGKPWRIGSSMSAGRTANGWFGCVGETRIVNHVLAPDKWLTARRYFPASRGGRGWWLRPGDAVADAGCARRASARSRRVSRRPTPRRRTRP